MKDNVQSTRQNTWASRLGRTLVVWDDAINIGPVENAVGNTLPRKWRRDIFALGGVLRGDVTIGWKAGSHGSISP